ncbi:MAG: hypothetical protein ABI083_02375 [Lapillicoccus sp.]
MPADMGMTRRVDGHDPVGARVTLARTPDTISSGPDSFGADKLG